MHCFVLVDQSQLQCTQHVICSLKTWLRDEVTFMPLCVRCYGLVIRCQPRNHLFYLIYCTTVTAAK